MPGLDFSILLKAIHDETITLHNHEIIMRSTAITRSQIENVVGKFFSPSGFESRSPGTKTLCATNELLWLLAVIFLTGGNAGAAWYSMAVEHPTPPQQVQLFFAQFLTHDLCHYNNTAIKATKIFCLLI